MFFYMNICTWGVNINNNSIQYKTIRCNTMQYDAIRCNTMQYDAMQFNRDVTLQQIYLDLIVSYRITEISSLS